MKAIIKILLAILSITVIVSCKKEGVGGKASVQGSILHHSLAIPNATVYVKYGAQEFPGMDPSAYESNVIAGSDGKFAFTELRKGNYYLFSIGLDTAISQTVRGGMPIEIKERTETVSKDLPVVE